jgi:predicted amidohydrolase
MADECPLAQASLLCALLSVPFFGVLAFPALILGFAARSMIANPKYRYTGDGVAGAGIIIATISLAAGAVGLMMFL